MTSLPDEIVNLENLRRLDLRRYEALTDLPAMSTGDLAELTSLVFDECTAQTPLPENVNALERLERFNARWIRESRIQDSETCGFCPARSEMKQRIGAQ